MKLSDRIELLWATTGYFTFQSARRIRRRDQYRMSAALLIHELIWLIDPSPRVRRSLHLAAIMLAERSGAARLDARSEIARARHAWLEDLEVEP